MLPGLQEGWTKDAPAPKRRKGLTAHPNELYHSEVFEIVQTVAQLLGCLRRTYAEPPSQWRQPLSSSHTDMLLIPRLLP